MDRWIEENRSVRCLRLKAGQSDRWPPERRVEASAGKVVRHFSAF
jgi:hypothetical protein